MKLFKNLSLKKILLSVFAPLTLATAIVGGTLVGDTAKAFSNIGGTTSVGPLYDFSKNCYDEAALNALAGQILNDTSKTINDLINHIKDESLSSGETIARNDLTVRYGRYRGDQSSPNYSELYWIPVYMSSTNEANPSERSAVLTLYLATANLSYSGYEYCRYSYNSYVSAAGAANPSNMYGTSYIRGSQKGLGNGGGYYQPGSTNVNGKVEVDIPTGSHKYVDFLEYSYGDSTRKGNLYDDIVEPYRIAWQSNESYAAIIGSTGKVTYNDGSTAEDGNLGANEHGGTDWEGYCWPNESYDSPNSGSFYHGEFFDYGGVSDTSAKREDYGSWKKDKLWIPSLTEVGTGDTGNLNGIWQLTKAQRSNMYGGMIGADSVAWLRTANTAYDETDGYSAAHLFVTEADGTVGTRRIDSSATIAMRPAIHLNLSSAVSKLEAPVNLPDEVTTTYNGNPQLLDDTHMTLTEEEGAWFEQGQMSVAFYYDKEKKLNATPVDAGEYYMVVTLSFNYDGYFLNPDPDNDRRKTVKFTINKAPIAIRWKYTNNKPSGVQLSSSTQFYERDITSGNTPEIGIRYTLYGSTKYYDDFNDLVRGTYTAKAYIIDEEFHNYNYKLYEPTADEIKGGTAIGDSTTSNSFAVGRMIVQLPKLSDAEPDEVTGNYQLYYKGTQYIQFENVNKYLLVSVGISTNSSSGRITGKIECLNDKQTFNGVEYPIVSDQGTLAYKIEGVGAFNFTFAFQNTSDFTWPGTYDFNTGTDNGAITTAKTIRVSVDESKLDADFVGLPTTWLSFQAISFTVELRGFYGLIDDAPLALNVYYMKSGTSDIKTLTPTDGVYKLPTLTEGEYTLYAGLDSSSIYYDFYLFDSGRKAQSFTVITAVSEFNANLVKWQYAHGDTVYGGGDYYEHDTEESAWEFYYDGDYYIFSLTISEATLRDVYYVKAVYSGSKFVKDAGLHCITVSIKAYYENVQVEESDYSLYFRIKPIKYDLSGLEWDYDDSNPLVFNNEKQKITLTAESLAALPGLTAEYVTEGNATDAGTYTTKVKFLVSGEYANNYLVPDLDDDSSYDGTFSFTCDWRIVKAKLTVEWETSGSSGDMLYIPVLKHGGEFVDYFFERLDNGSWVEVDSLDVAGAPEIFRRGVRINAANENNYELTGNIYSDQFTVESGKHAVSIHFEVNGEICNNGDKFKYTGNPLELELVVDYTEDIVAKYEFTYFRVVGGQRQALSEAPFDIGSYVAKVTATYSTDSYISSGETEVSFEIVKGDYDPNQIYWMYIHGDTIIAGKYDAESEKYVDDLGREVRFSFEYDGTQHILTVESQQRFNDPSDLLTVASTQGNYGTNAGKYIAIVNFTYNTDRFNTPYNVFPRTLNWEIVPKKINYNEVRWGYIDKDGEEHDFDFDSDSFRYTRDEDGAVSYTVALLGLPKGIQDLMIYTTENLSIVNSTPTAGSNSRAAVGEYRTSFTIKGEWNDPEGNYEPFDAATFPPSIPASQTWSIKRRELSKFADNVSWKTFDNRVHDLLELTGIPYNELTYLKLDITFVDYSNIVYNEYEGYKGVTYALYHAGIYEIKLYEITTTIRNDEEVDELVIRDTLPLTVEKALLEVVWDEDGAYPVARAKNISWTDMIDTIYTRANGAVVPIAYIISTNNNEEFFATAKIAGGYEYDIDMVFAEGQKESLGFFYEPFEGNDNSVALAKPVLTFSIHEYTGGDITFVIDGWETTYSSYLYISAGSLTQRDQGEYSVVLRFNKNANAYWNFASPTGGDYNRDAFTLKFKIVPPTRWALDYPMLDETQKQWTGEEIEFSIINWITLSRYVTYEVLYRNESLGKEVNLFFKHGGIYTIVFTIPEDSIGYWREREGKDDEKGEFRLQFNIIGDPDAPVTEILYPELISSSSVHTGSPIQFKVANWDTYFKQFLVITSKDDVTIVDGIIAATNVGTYTITFTFKEGVDYTFVGGAKEYSLSFTILPPDIEGGDPIGIQKPEFSETSVEWTGDWIEFSITNWSTLYKNYLVISYDGNMSEIEIDQEKGIIRVKNVKKYAIIISFKEGANAFWAGTNNLTDSIELTIEITAPDDPTLVVPPSFIKDEKSYNGKQQTFELENLNSDKVSISGDSLTQKDVGNYRITLSLKNKKSEDNPDGDTWLDGTTDDIYREFRIVKAKLPEGSHVGVGSDGKPRLEDENGNPWPDFDFDFGDMFDVVYEDENGNIVDEKDLVPGGKYTVKLVPKEDKIKDSVEGANDLIKDVQDKNEAGGWNITFVNNGGENPPGGGGGDNKTLWIVLGVVGGVALLAIIITVIVLLTRKNGDDGYDDGYDDDYEDDDDDDDYDDDDDDDYDDDDY